MPAPSPFHIRTSALCSSHLWKDWAGFFAVRAYDTYMEREYFAFRHSAGLIDVTPLYKYDIQGPDAGDFLARIMVKNVKKLDVGQVTYCCWCDDQGKVVDDGTVTRLQENFFRVTAAEPSYAWFLRHRRGFDVEITDVSETLAALSLQGPMSRDILQQVAETDLKDLKFFRMVETRIKDIDAIISRTGYTGDLGFEIWADESRALDLWDVMMAAGEPYRMEPAGLDAMDMTRVEAGFIMNGVDYFSAQHCLIENRKSTPYELALGWTVNLDREPFNGQAALRKEKKEGSRRAFVGLDIDWNEYEELYQRHGLPPEVPPGAWRTPVPVYAKGGGQIGQATSGSWSPILKKNLALATVAWEHRKVGTELEIEVTVEYERHRVTARVLKKPFFDPERKKA